MTKADEYLVRDIHNILENGIMDENPRPKYADGTPAHTCFVTHVVRQYDLSKGEFPICTLRPIAWKSAIKEMFWIFQDQSNDLSLLREKYGIKVWDAWESKDMPGTIGRRYGGTVKKYDLMNKRVLGDIKTDPYGRYHIMNLWQEQDMAESDGLKPCAYETIFTVRGRYLDMVLNQRSGDMLVASGAGHWNEVQYAALLMMVARDTGYEPGKFTHMVINEQIYDRHLDQAKVLLNRAEEMKRESIDCKPCMLLNPEKKNFYDITIEDFSLTNYAARKPQLSFELGV